MIRCTFLAIWDRLVEYFGIACVVAGYLVVKLLDWVADFWSDLEDPDRDDDKEGDREALR